MINYLKALGQRAGFRAGDHAQRTPGLVRNIDHIKEIVAMQQSVCPSLTA